MTVLVKIGRRVPRSWYRRSLNRVGGLITFQENIWLMIKQSMRMAMKKANASGKCKFVIDYEDEDEDLNYKLEWMKITILASKELEKEEYEESMDLYTKLGSVLKTKEFPKDERFSKFFKTKVLSSSKVDEAYKKGHGALSDNNIANKLLEMGILTHVELIDDYDIRDDEFLVC